jgi:glycosyltransferase involved in cell wall biosynthesis
VPENANPSWGAGMIYYHVWLLNKNGFSAYVLHDKKPYQLSWISVDVRFQYLNDKNLSIRQQDVLVVPEFYADLAELTKFNCRKIVFVQNAFYIFDGLQSGKSYDGLGYETVFYYMPHLQKVLSKVTSLPLYETPPFIAPYFFSADEVNNQRKKKILIYPKFGSRDFSILKRMLDDKLGIKEKSRLEKLLSKKNEWQIVELKNKGHKEVAEEMKQATFFISLNTTEAFNSSVPEAMAAGCVNICYEGVGPADFLANETNAFVFSNNHIFPLINKVIELVQRFDEMMPLISSIRSNARKTADCYTIAELEVSLVSFFTRFIIRN